MSMKKVWDNFAKRFSAKFPHIDLSSMSTTMEQGDQMFDNMGRDRQRILDGIALNPEKPQLVSLTKKGAFGDTSFAVIQNFSSITEALRNSTFMDVDSANQEQVFDKAFESLSEQINHLTQLIDGIKPSKIDERVSSQISHKCMMAAHTINDFFIIMDEYTKGQKVGLDSVAPQDTRKLLYDVQSVEGVFRGSIDNLEQCNEFYKEGFNEIYGKLMRSVQERGVPLSKSSDYEVLMSPL